MWPHTAQKQFELQCAPDELLVMEFMDADADGDTLVGLVEVATGQLCQEQFEMWLDVISQAGERVGRARIKGWFSGSCPQTLS